MKYIYVPYDKHKTNTSTPFVSQLIQIGDFAVQSNLDGKKTTKSNLVFQNVLSYTLDSIGTQYTTTLGTPFKNVTLEINKKKVSSYLKYSSLEKIFLQSLDYVYYNFPASILIDNNIYGKQGLNILNSTYNPITNKTSFVVNTNFISNPMEINYLNVDLPNRDKFAVHRNLKDSYINYLLDVDGVLYQISNFEGSNRLQNSYISIEVIGKPFENGNHSQICYITPSTQTKNTFISDAPQFVKILLRNEKLDGYYPIFEDEELTPNGQQIIYDLTVIFPKSDKYNLDVTSTKFTDFKSIFTDYAVKQDNNISNLVQRKFVEPNLLLPIIEGFDSTENQFEKFETLLSVFAFGFDEQYKFINAIKNLNILTYDNENNLPVELLDLFLSSHGIEISNTITTEKKRELGLSLPWLIKSKGTRSAINYIFQFFNIPLDMVKFSEQVKKIETPINMTLFNEYLTLIYGSSDLTNISVTTDGYPQGRPEFIFEDNNYWSQFYVLDEGLNGKYKQQIKNITTQSIIYENSFELSGTTFDYTLLSSSCYTLQSSVVDDVLKVPLYDECGCEVEYEEKALQLTLTPKPLYTGCTAPILDIWQECISAEEIKVHVIPYGGVPPYSYIGLENESILPPNNTYSVQVIDSVGCESLTATGTTYCYKEFCVTNPIVVTLGYECNYSEGLATGDATVLLLFSGGTAPYIIHGNENGDILPNGETIATEITDSNGCTSGIITRLITCETLSCEPIFLTSTAECTSNVRISDTKINVTYDIENVPNTTEVQSVVMTISKASGTGNIYGGTITEMFSGDFGAKTVVIDSTPTLGTIVLTVEIGITLANGCIYSDSYDLSVDCTTLNIPDTYTNTLQ